MNYNQEREYFCNTCVTNENIERLDSHEKQVPTNKNVFIPMNIRQTNGLGIIFTKESIFYDYHVNHGSHHDWGNVAEAERNNECISNLQKRLDNTPLL